MSCVRKDANGVYTLYIKGSLQSMLDIATHYFDGKQTCPLTEQYRSLLLTHQDQRSQNAMRNLCYGYTTLDTFDEHMELEEVEKGITILGIVSMIDPPREEVSPAVEAAYASGIRVFVITGDYALTAQAIATRI